MSPDHLLPAGPQAQGHQGAVIGRVGFVDAHQRHAAGLQPIGFEREVQLVAGLKSDRERALSQVAGGGLTGRVDQCSGLDSSGEVGANDDVVRDGIEGCRGYRRDP